MSTSPGFRRGRLDVVMPNAAALRRGSLWTGFGKRHAPSHSPPAGDVQCLGGCLWELGDCDEPCRSPMIYRNGKVNRLPQRRSRNASEGELSYVSRSPFKLACPSL